MTVHTTISSLSINANCSDVLGRCGLPGLCGELARGAKVRRKLSHDRCEQNCCLPSAGPRPARVARRGASCAAPPTSASRSPAATAPPLPRCSRQTRGVRGSGIGCQRVTRIWFCIFEDAGRTSGSLKKPTAGLNPCCCIWPHPCACFSPLEPDADHCKYGWAAYWQT